MFIKVNAYSGNEIMPYVIQKEAITAIYRMDCMQGRGVMHIRLSSNLEIKVTRESERIIINNLGGIVI